DVFARHGVSRTGPPPTKTSADRTLNYLEASMEAIAEEMKRDPSVFYMGEDVRVSLYGNFPLNEFAEERVRDTPISEPAFVGAAIGAAMTGMRPVVQMGIAT